MGRARGGGAVRGAADGRRGGVRAARDASKKTRGPAWTSTTIASFPRSRRRSPGRRCGGAWSAAAREESRSRRMRVRAEAFRARGADARRSRVAIARRRREIGRRPRIVFFPAPQKERRAKKPGRETHRSCCQTPTQEYVVPRSMPMAGPSTLAMMSSHLVVSGVRVGSQRAVAMEKVTRATGGTCALFEAAAATACGGEFFTVCDSSIPPISIRSFVVEASRRPVRRRIDTPGETTPPPIETSGWVKRTGQKKRFSDRTNLSKDVSRSIGSRGRSAGADEEGEAGSPPALGPKCWERSSSAKLRTNSLVRL